MKKKYRKYLVTAFFPKNQLEKEEYLLWSLNMIQEDEKEKCYERDRKKFTLKFYLNNEIKLIEFFKSLFYLNDNYIECYLKPVSTFSKYYFLKNERNTFWKYMKRLNFNQLFLKKKIEVKDIHSFIFYMKFGYRANQEDVTIIFKKLKIKIVSTGEYSYLMTIYNNSKLKEFFESLYC